MHVFSCMLKSFCVQVTYTDTSVHPIFQVLVQTQINPNQEMMNYYNQTQCTIPERIITPSNEKSILTIYWKILYYVH